MTTQALTRPAFGTPSELGIVGRIADRFGAWRRARQTRNALLALTDRELEDIGLSRAEIDDVVATALQD